MSDVLLEFAQGDWLAGFFWGIWIATGIWTYLMRKEAAEYSVLIERQSNLICELLGITNQQEPTDAE